MLIVQILRWLLLVAEIGIALPVAYLCLLSLSAVVTTRRRARHQPCSVAGTPSTPTLCPRSIPSNLAGGVPATFSGGQEETSTCRFAILIPAHNEQEILPTLLSSLAEVDYPRDRYTVCVVADNCIDTTAELARALGWPRVYERFDTTKRGKGYALNWLLAKLEEEERIFDAYVVLDADSVVEPAFLRALARELANGVEAAQACNTVLNVTEAPSTALRWVALSLVNHVRPLGRNGIGGSSTLTGNGMCLSRAILQRHPWQAFGIAEDYQYYLTLMEQGGKAERVSYVPEAVVRSHMPTTFTQMRTQDIRWEASQDKHATWRVALRLLKAGIKSHDLVRLDAVAELLTPPLSSLVCWCLLAVIASLAVWSVADLLFSCALVCGMLFYISTAAYLLRPPHSAYRAFLHAPGFVLWKLWVYFVLRRSKKHTSEWVRTSRTLSPE